MANRGAQQSNTVDIATAMNQMSLADRTMHPPLRSAVSDSSARSSPSLALPPGGIAARRQRMNAPKLNVNDISDVFPAGGGPSGAGLGGGRPSIGELPQRSPHNNIGTPFSNFRKIV